MFSALSGPFGPTLGAPNSAGSPPVITSPSFLVAGTVNSLYPTTYFTATGTAPITWSITAGTLPAGMTFTTVSNQGVLSGTPTATSSGSITFTATNAYGSDSRALTLTVGAAAAFDITVNLINDYGNAGSFSVPVSENVTVNAEVTSEAVRLTGLGAASNRPALTTIAPQAGRPVTISVNGGAFLSTAQSIAENDVIRCKTTVTTLGGSVDTGLVFSDGGFWGSWSAWCANTSRAPVTKQVGAGKTYATIAAAINSGLVAGDTIEIDPGTYSGAMASPGGTTAAAYVITNGTPSLPITFRGVGVTRPIINVTSSGNRAFWIAASNIVVENFEFTGSGQDYVQVQQSIGNNVTYDRCFFNGNISTRGGNAFLSNDFANGTQIFTRCEFRGFGGTASYGPAEHGIYVSGNWQAYPDHYLEVNSCFFDYITNNQIKSRARDNRIYFNTLVGRAGVAYAVETIRNYEFSLDGSSYTDIFGNLFVRNMGAGSNNVASIRIDDDGNGSASTKLRLVNNSFWRDSTHTVETGLAKAFISANTVYEQNNAVVNESGASTAVSVFEMDYGYPGAPGWINGKKLALVNNWLPPSSVDRLRDSGGGITTTPVVYGGPPNNVQGTGGVVSSVFASLDMTPSAGSGLIASGTSISTMPADYTIPYFNSTLNRKPLPISFVSGTTISYQPQSVTLPIGAIGV